MLQTAKLFKHGKPTIRPFQFVEGTDAGDVPYVWDAYKKGDLKGYPEDMDLESFSKLVDFIKIRTDEAYTVEDKVNGESVPVAIVLCRNNGWQLEPHVQYFGNASPRTVLRTYVGFIKKMKYRKDIGACVIKVNEKQKILPNRLEGIGLLEYVGKVWNGTPSGNEYVYSMRCKRRDLNE